ncbi:MAG: 6,7-dimethyl-8-ribityllumazine synthase [Paludibacteraceae bacterium]|nr:6,7-dimethyl-8-ribityllumazine synthase [Paludibacteraceae bacterium]
MATRLHNLSDFDPQQLPDAETLRGQSYAIIVADWNSDITYPRMEGAVDTLLKAGVPAGNIEITHVPGAVELTYAAARYVDRFSGLYSSSDIVSTTIEHGVCSNLTPREEFDAIIVIGCVIKGDTPHFDYVCQSVTAGVTQLNAAGHVPVVFSVLTTLDRQQALDRAGGRLGNKGVEGAYTAIRMANLTAEHNRYLVSEKG